MTDYPGDYNEHQVTVGDPRSEAAGIRAVLVALRRA